MAVVLRRAAILYQHPSQTVGLSAEKFGPENPKP
jgi:hypothetical protein